VKAKKKKRNDEKKKIDIGKRKGRKGKSLEMTRLAYFGVRK
jgi:hypothetical protein